MCNIIQWHVGKHYKHTIHANTHTHTNTHDVAPWILAMDIGPIATGGLKPGALQQDAIN